MAPQSVLAVPPNRQQLKPMCENDAITEGRRGTCLTELTRHKSSVCDAGFDAQVGGAAVVPDPQIGSAAKCAREDSSENTVSRVLG